MTKRTILSENLKNLRLRLNFTQSDIAEIIEKDRSSVAKYESGAALPPFNVLILFAKLYDVTIDELCGIENPTALTVRSNDEADEIYDKLLSGFDKQEQLMILKFKTMDKEKKQEFLKILEEFSKK